MQVHILMTVNLLILSIKLFTSRHNIRQDKNVQFGFVGACVV